MMRQSVVTISALTTLWPGINARKTQKDVSNTPVMTLFADPAVTSTSCSTRPRRPDGVPMKHEGASGVVGVVAVTARIIGIGVRSAVLETEKETVNKAIPGGRRIYKLNNERGCKDASLLRDQIINVYTSSDAEEQSSVLVPCGDDGQA
ncbi:hypothetical protein F5J12DRAFT_973562 [Pisolithus orientalis]|uniref:uncharacterized protein n=1 Tax=Pisolithus orientalis TaxID=936130 RepID=UPI00222469A0|nr:uncharacterized protein F5J12DRAFT_973562 [Pisolithus orientalis]KAI6010968.1 hypothetical protein F5J12DRAFT_973562 [Pisolithus orientalis]